MHPKIWIDAQTNYFVHVYKSHECLWNNPKDRHINKFLQNAAYSDIKEKMKRFEYSIFFVSPEDINEKITSLWSKYYEIKNQNSTSAVCPSEKEGSWYKEMEEMDNAIKMFSQEPTTSEDISAPEVDTAEESKSDLPIPEIDTQEKVVEVMDTDEIKQVDTSENKLADTNEIKLVDTNEIKLADTNEIKLVDTNEIKLEKTPQIQKRKTSSIKKPSHISLQMRIEILDIMKKLLTDKYPPNYNNMFDLVRTILLKANHEIELTDDDKRLKRLDVFREELHVLGFLVVMTKNGIKMIIENPEQRFERYLYLNKMNKLRRTKKVVYIDERIINLKHTFEKYQMNEALPPESSIFFHAISKDGYINGLFCNEATEHDFQKWVTDILLGLLDGPCVIVMDNNPLHGKLEDTCNITRYSTTAKMLQWLNSHNVPCSPNTSKPELFELIKTIKKNSKEKEYKIDKIIRSYGHVVLRLPNSFPDLNMSHFMWKEIAKNKLDLKRSKTFELLQNRIVGYILPSMANKWGLYETHVTANEQNIFKIDTTIESLLDAYEFVAPDNAN